MSARTKRLLLGALVAGAIALPAVQKARANDDATNPPQSGGQQAPVIDAQANQLLHQMTDFLAAQNVFTVRAESSTEVVLTSGEKLQFDASSEIAVQRPNKLRSQRKGALVDATLYYDGQSLTIAGKNEAEYASIAAPASLDETIDFARQKFDIDAPGADLLYSNAYNPLVEDVISGMYVDLDDVDGTACHHLSFKGNGTDWQIWIEDGERPLPRKFLIVSKLVTELPEFEVRLRDWRLDAEIPDSAFTFTPRSDARKVDFPTADKALLSPSGR
jgi:hypothetical protein